MPIFILCSKTPHTPILNVYASVVVVVVLLPRIPSQSATAPARRISISSNPYTMCKECWEINFAFYYILKSGPVNPLRPYKRPCRGGGWVEGRPWTRGCHKIVGNMQKLKMGNSILLPIWVAFMEMFDRHSKSRAYF